MNYYTQYLCLPCVGKPMVFTETVKQYRRIESQPTYPEFRLLKPRTWFLPPVMENVRLADWHEPWCGWVEIE